MSTKRATMADGRAPVRATVADHNAAGRNTAGWYPDPSDPRGLRYWDGEAWTDHRAQISNPVGNPAVCACGVVATGSCRRCARPFCRTHISEQPRDDRAYRCRWDAWMCTGCIEDARRQRRAEQLERCEAVAPRLQSIGKMRRARTFTGLRPRRVDLFEQRAGNARPLRAARAYLIEYDGGEPDSTFAGLALSADGTTVYDVGAPTKGVASSRIGPKLRHSGYRLRALITIDLLREAALAPTDQNWFESAARRYLRAAHRMMIDPTASAPMLVDITGETEINGDIESANGHEQATPDAGDSVA